MAEAILGLAVLLIALGVVFGTIRLALGDSATDRIIAVDLLTIIALSLIALLAHYDGRVIYLDVALVYGLLSFLGVMAVARYLENGLGRRGGESE
ncbi:MAG: cation:proton antiporter [Chromatiales bacterium]|nr:cation:proton antiporter [Chromatiales bacterium]